MGCRHLNYLCVFRIRNHYDNSHRKFRDEFITEVEFICVERRLNFEVGLCIKFPTRNQNYTWDSDSQS